MHPDKPTHRRPSSTRKHPRARSSTTSPGPASPNRPQRPEHRAPRKHGKTGQEHGTSSKPSSAEGAISGHAEKLHATSGERATMSAERRGFSEYNAPQSSTFMMSGLAKVSVVFLALVLLGAILFSVVRHTRQQKPPALNKITCDSPSCQRYQKLLEGVVDREVDPCHDYYSYVCGPWTRSRSRQISVQHMLLQQFIRDAMDRMRNEAPTVASDVTQKGMRFFQVCLSVINTSHVDGVKKLLAEGGILWPSRNPKPDFLNALFYMSRSLFNHIIFEFSIENGSVFVVRSSEYFLKQLEFLRDHVKSRHFLQHLRITYEIFGALDESRLDEIIAHFDRFEQFIYMYLNTSLFNRPVSKVFWKNDTASFLRLTPTIPLYRWEALLRRHLNISFAYLSSIRVVDVKRFAAVFNLHKDMGEAAMNDVIEAICAQRLVHYTSIDIIVSFYRTADIATEQLHEECFQSTFTFFGYDVNHYFLISRRHALGNLERLADNVRHAYSADLNQSVPSGHHPAVGQNGSDTYFRKLFDLLEKSKARQYPPAYYAYPKLTNDPLLNWKIMNEYYYQNRSVAHSSLIKYDTNEFSKFRGFSLLIQHLDYPYYAADAHRGVVLGGIGSRLAAAVFYDHVESHVDFQKIYERNHRCLAGDSGGEPDLDLQGAVAAAPVVSSMLRAASVAKNDTLVEDLPSFKTDRLPFLFGCYLLCGEHNGTSMCNVPMRHSVDFADAYKCPAGSAMNPSHKCVMVPSQ